MPVAATLTPEMPAIRAPLREVAADVRHAAAAAPVHRLRHVWLGEGVSVYFGVGGVRRGLIWRRGACWANWCGGEVERLGWVRGFV